VTSRISHTTVDCHDAYAQSVWWGEVLGMAEDPSDPNEPSHEECMIFTADGRTRVLFIKVPEAKQGGRRPDGSGWFTLADPEGNEFCVLRGDLEIVDPYAHLVAAPETT
jgi:hypothetical protein